jgi:REP element-mobilizing transposase RayT
MNIAFPSFRVFSSFMQKTFPFYVYIGEALFLFVLHLICMEILMARPLRINLPGLFHHVMNRSNERRQIFYDDADHYLLINAIFTFSSRYNIIVIAYAIMPNHFHLMVHDREGNLSRFMHDMSSTFAFNYNRKNNRVGHVFQGRFKSQVVDSTKYAVALSRYIHLNPVNISKYAATTLEEKAEVLKNYRWSSLAHYVSPDAVQNLPCFNPGEVLNHFGSDHAEQINNYNEFIIKSLSESPDDIRAAVFDHVVEQCVIGDGAFLDTVRDKVRIMPTTNPKADKLTSIPLDTVEQSLMSIPGISYDELHARGRGNTAFRNTIIYLTSKVSMTKATLTEIGRYFGGLTVSSVSRIIRKVHESFVTDGLFRNLIIRMEECLYSRADKQLALLDISCIRTAYG